MALIEWTCNDLLFSGHTVNLTISALTWTMFYNVEYKYLPSIIIKIVAWLVAFTGYFFIISTRFHYSIDVLIAFVLCIGLWALYFEYISNIQHKNTKFSSFLSWFEAAPDSYKPLSYPTDQAGANGNERPSNATSVA